jgi:hypothetical protein
MSMALIAAVLSYGQAPIEDACSRSYHSPEQVADYVRLALDGDPDAISELLAGLPDSHERICVVLRLAGLVCPEKPQLRPVLTRALSDIWDHHDMMLLMHALSASRAAFVALCDLGAPPDVSDLPQLVRVYRGGGDARAVARGMSWSLDPTVAEFFARQRVTSLGSYCADRTGPSCVVEAKVDRSAIVLRVDSREEAEVILRRAPRRIALYGGEEKAA